MDKAELFLKLKAAGWTDHDLAMLSHAVTWDKQIAFEEIINFIGHWAEEHDDRVACEALVSFLKFTHYAYEGIQRARFAGNCISKEIDDQVAHYAVMLRKAIDMKETMDRKEKLKKELDAMPMPMEIKGRVH